MASVGLTLGAISKRLFQDDVNDNIVFRNKH